ncbi:hypothetical protein [Novosphingobium lentum]|uniref:hypothetical protein n=1 Tax=Novosphingobium lentum TaxID=145287 RepID=UPI00082FA4AC|nr:hypothetical protein [Novosphingobium lentum]
MWFSILLPTLDTSHAMGRLAKLHANVGSRLEAGDVFADLSIDLSAGVARDCPPVMTCRIILQETVWLRDVLMSSAAVFAGGSLLALVSTDPRSSPEAPCRSVRTTMAVILHHEEWWVPRP